jgi:transcriptional regulator with XRE-family HTH domain
MTVTRLASALRELRARTGLSLKALADRTPYSKSSWERYLNGKSLPPRQAVRDLCRVAGESEGRYLALWEIAESESSGRATEARAPTAPPEPEAPRARRGTPPMVLGALLLATAATAVTVAVLPHQETGPHPTTTPSPSSSPAPRCQGAACEGKDPLHMGCGRAPATLATHRTATGAELELRYNARCGTSWARMWGTRIGDRLEVTTGHGPAHGARIRDDVDAEAYVYTSMAATRPGAVVRACFIPATGGERERECFDSRVRRSR